MTATSKENIDPERGLTGSDERNLVLAAERDHGLQRVIITENSCPDDLVTDGRPVLYRLHAAFLGGPDEFDQETLYAIMKNAEDVLFFKPGITRGDFSRAVDAAVRGGSAVIASTNEDYDHLWNLYMSIVRPWLTASVSEWVEERSEQSDGGGSI